jgi:hypothetical protein
MKMANEKQALYINKLSYTLYKLKGCNNFNIVVPVEEAAKLSADVAEDMIREFQEKIWEKELEVYVRPYMYDYDKLERLYKFVIPAFKKIDKVKPVDNNLYVYTTDGTEYLIDSKKTLILGRHYSNIKQLYEIFVKAINHDENVRIYVSDSVCSVYVEDKEKDLALAQAVSLVNSVIDAIEGMIPLDHRAEFHTTYLNKIINYLEARDTALASEVKRVFQNEVEANNFCMILTGKKEHYFALHDERE